MAIKIGQIRKNNSTSYLEDLNYTITTFESEGISGNKFQDFAIQGTFALGETYYIRLRVKRIDINKNMGSISGAGDNDPHNLNVDIRLYSENSSSSSYQTIGDPVLIQPFASKDSDNELTIEKEFIDWCYNNLTSDSPSDEAKAYLDSLKAAYNKKAEAQQNVAQGINSEFQTIELVFTPYRTCQVLVFQLRRVAYDYNTEPRIIELLESDTPDIARVNKNILSRQALKIGVQSRPGTLVIINDEPMRIGKSGVLEINNGITVYSVGFAAPNKNIDDFILDYIYEE